MRKKTLDTLVKKIQNETGIDFKAYDSGELFEKISDLVTFPVYAVRTLLMPIIIILIFLIIAIIWSFAIKGAVAFGIVLILLGLPLSVANGVLIGQVLLIRKTSEDVNRILFLSLELSEQIITDIGKLQSKINDKNFKLPKVTDIIQGAIYAVIVPNVLQVVKEKIPIVGRFVSAVISTIMYAAITRLKDKEEEVRKETGIDEKFEKTVDVIDDYMDKSIVQINRFQEKIDNVIERTIRIATFPFKTISAIVLIFSAIVLSIFYLVLV